MNATKPSQTNATVQSHRFTLVEMMVVVVIITIVVGISIPAFQKMGSGSSVRAGTRVLAAQIRLTRQFAISQRRTVALLVPGNEISALADELCYVAMKPAIVTRDPDDSRKFKFFEWVDGTRWLYIPRGAVIAELDEDVGIADGGTYEATPHETASVLTTVTVVLDKLKELDEDLSGTTDVDVRAIVFSPTGRVLGLSSANATVAQIMYDSDTSGDWICRDKGEDLADNPGRCTSNQFNIGVNSFTGRIKIQTIDQY